VNIRQPGLVAAGLFVLVPYLVLVEWLLRDGPRRRLHAVVLGAVMASGGLVLSQLGHIGSVSWQGTLVVLSTALLGGIFGAVVKLPRSGVARDVRAR
jgi:hypothetical protein